MSNERRKYTKRRRAETEQETRQRITEAAMALHGSVGPARTTISAIAEKAGVQRATVYRHFPDEETLFAACSGHFRALNPPPDPAALVETADPATRLRRALTDTYAYSRRTEGMVETVLRDAPLVEGIPPCDAARCRLTPVPSGQRSIALPHRRSQAIRGTGAKDGLRSGREDSRVAPGFRPRSGAAA